MHGVRFGSAHGQRRPMFHAKRIGIEPAIDKAAHPQVSCERRFLGSTRERLQRPAIVLRSEHDEGFAAGVKRMQVEQRIMLCQQRAKPVGDMILELLRSIGRQEIAVEVAVSHALLPGIGKRIGNRNEGDAASHQPQAARADLLRHSLDRPGAAGFVAMHCAQNDQPRSGLQAGIRLRMEVERVHVLHRTVLLVRPSSP